MEVRTVAKVMQILNNLNLAAKIPFNYLNYDLNQFSDN